MLRQFAIHTLDDSRKYELKNGSGSGTGDGSSAQGPGADEQRQEDHRREDAKVAFALSSRNAQIAVPDTGGQYCHLIARKVRELGVSSDVFSSDTALDKLRGARGVIISGGPHSVYDDSSPTIERSVLAAGVPVLGICAHAGSRAAKSSSAHTRALRSKATPRH